MTEVDQKRDLLRYLRSARDALLWKLDGCSEYDIRRPLVPTGTNLLGLVKHAASVEAGYLGDVFGRPFGEPMPWMDEDAAPNADLFATSDQSREWVIGFYRRVAEHSAATVEALPLDAVGRVPWWEAERAEVTLHRILVHVIAETSRHAGHADVVRELVDGSVGLQADYDNLPFTGSEEWAAYRRMVEQAAREARVVP